jgi:hypothetical protein
VCTVYICIYNISCWWNSHNSRDTDTQIFRFAKTYVCVFPVIFPRTGKNLFLCYFRDKIATVLHNTEVVLVDQTCLFRYLAVADRSETDAAGSCTDRCRGCPSFYRWLFLRDKSVYTVCWLFCKLYTHNGNKCSSRCLKRIKTRQTQRVFTKCIRLVREFVLSENRVKTNSCCFSNQTCHMLLCVCVSFNQLPHIFCTFSTFLERVEQFS